MALPALPALGKVGSILSGIGGLFGRKRGPSPSEQAYGQLQGAFKAADEAGLHRLAVAGSPAGYSPAPQHDGEGVMALGNAVREYAQDRTDKKTRQKQDALIDAQIEEARSRTILNQANARRAVSGPQPGLGQASNPVQEAFDRLSNDGSRRINREPERDQPATQTVTLGRFTGRGPNPEAFEVGLSELAAGVLMYGPQYAAEWAREMGEPAAENNRSRYNQRPKYRPKPAKIPIAQGRRNSK